MEANNVCYFDLLFGLSLARAMSDTEAIAKALQNAVTVCTGGESAPIDRHVREVMLVRIAKALEDVQTAEAYLKAAMRELKGGS